VSGLLQMGEALERVLERVRPLPAESVPIREAAGRVLAEDARAATDLPPFDSSAMDGFAVRAVDTPGRLTIVDQSAAGAPAGLELGAGEAIAISTGAVVPAAADAVIQVERTRSDGAAVEVEQVVQGDNIRPRGGDTRAGDLAAAAGSRLRAADVAALAAVGLATVMCARRPLAAVLATGSELRAPGTPLGPGEIYESNTVLLAAQLASAGVVASVLDPVPDDAAATRAALEEGLRHDLLITSGGVSVGEHDLVRATLAELGVEEAFWGVAVKPGKPVAFGTREATLAFGLPGNPVSSLVGFELFVRPAVLALQGLRDPRPRWRPGRLATAFRAGGRDELVRARSRVEDGAVVLEPVGGQESHMIVRAASADALVLVPADAGSLEPGAAVSYLELA
jgi:molybdopterin molybdotransferase